MMRFLASLPLLLLIAALTGCGQGEAPPATEPAATVAAEDSYERRLTPVARVKNATEIRVEGKDAWVSVPVESTSTSAVLECLQLLPAKLDDETLTVIFSDGVEEQCEWPEEE